MQRLVTSTTLVVGVALAASGAHAHSFGLDDNPANPETGFLGFGFGAENPFGWMVPGFPPGYAPSPTLGALPCFDADLLMLGPVIDLPSPNGVYDDSLSNNAEHFHIPADMPVRLRFTVDRLSVGVNNSQVRVQANLNQQPGDVFLTTDWFQHPAAFVGTPGPIPYGGMLAAHIPGPLAPSNHLLVDESRLGLTCGGMIVPPNVAAPPIQFGTHDNLEQYDRQLMDRDQNQVPDDWMYFSIYPDEAWVHPLVILSAADIFDLPPWPVLPAPWPRLPFALAAQMGLDIDEVGDSIDALVLFDRGPVGGPEWDGPGAQPEFDFALFSLAPGSQTLQQYGICAADIYFTDFTGKFFTYATCTELGLTGLAGGPPGEGDNVDGLEIRPPCPADLNLSDDVDFGDILAIIAAWGNVGVPEDLNNNGVVDFADILMVVTQWGPCR
ncbi:MAG: hypothetical protein GY715_00300 [Planctomycetes bacterium]|nr:hypothetical protein [Planctomycetota bacterium]